jgi:hypothetical protein
VTTRDAAKRAARAALADLGIDTPPGQWGDAEADAALDVARVLADLAEASTTIRERRTGEGTWTRE